MTQPSEASAIELSNVSCARTGEEGRLIESVRGISVSFPQRSFTLVAGTLETRALLFRLLSLVETPDDGDVLVHGSSTRALDDAARADIRARRLGLVYASPFLLPSLSAIENIAVPLFKVAGMEPEEARTRAEAALEFVGLSGLEQMRSGDLTRYEQQCVSLARALAVEPGVVLVEELDSTVGADGIQQFCDLLRQAADRFGVCAVATASPDFAAGASCRVVSIENGATDSALLREPLA
jgi:predicted ABC-type transport system involved in lysophospholipase L1 biosynthesis ATPase subunit